MAAKIIRLRDRASAASIIRAMISQMHRAAP
jgi:hypothetical protein